MKQAIDRSGRRAREGLTLSLALVLTSLAAGPVLAQDFEAVLATPDDIDQNLAYARAAADTGDLNGAVSALERVLIADPNRHGVRLLYAVLLFRLDGLQGAREQLDLLEPVTLTPLQRAEAQRYRRAIERGHSRTRFSGVLSAGVVYEDDAAGALTTQFDTPVLPPASEDGTSVVVSGRLNLIHDLGPEPGLALYGSAGAYDKSTVSGADGDLRRGDIEAGLSHQGRLNRWSLGAVARRYDLLDDPYLVEVGVRGQSSWRLTTATTLSLSGEAVNQAFDEPVVDAVAPFIGGDRDGWRYDLTAGLGHRLSARANMGVSIGWQDKQADYEPFGYSGWSLQGNIEGRTRRGAYLRLSGGVQYLDYDAPDLFFGGFGAPTREDERVWARLAAGAPLSAFSAAGATADWREDVTLEAALTYGGRDSGPPLADYDSWGAELRLAWRFGARD